MRWRTRGGFAVGSPADQERSLGWNQVVARGLDDITAVVPPGHTFILVDQDEWDTADHVAGRPRMPFLERNGRYWGSPADDAVAIREVERLRQMGATFIAVARPAFWWLKYYAAWHRDLRTRWPCILENDRVIVYDLRATARQNRMGGVGLDMLASARGRDAVVTPANRHERWQQTGDLRAFEARVFSQNGEDGIIKEILRRVGVERRFFVEIGASAGVECNCARLAVEEHWRGLFIEGDARSAQELASRYRDRPGVQCAHAWVTAHNVEALLESHEVPRRFDVLSIDIDGNDYWVWRAIRRWQPRVVVIEYNASHAPARKWVMKQNPGHRWDGTQYFGASLTSLSLLAKKKGYVLVATDSMGVNAFFVSARLVTPEKFLDPAVHYHYSPPRYGYRGTGHPPGSGPFVER